MRKLMLVVPVVMLAAGSTACATKKFVRGEVGQVNSKVESLSTQLEETQERTKKNEQKIGEVDQKADAAGKSADEARSAANTAGEAAKVAGAKAEAVDTASKRLIFEVVLISAWLSRLCALIIPAVALARRDVHASEHERKRRSDEGGREMRFPRHSRPDGQDTPHQRAVHEADQQRCPNGASIAPYEAGDHHVSNESVDDPACADVNRRSAHEPHSEARTQIHRRQHAR